MDDYSYRHALSSCGNGFCFLCLDQILVYSCNRPFHFNYLIESRRLNAWPPGPVVRGVNRGLGGREFFKHQPSFHLLLRLKALFLLSQDSRSIFIQSQRSEVYLNKIEAVAAGLQVLRYIEP